MRLHIAHVNCNWIVNIMLVNYVHNGDMYAECELSDFENRQSPNQRLSYLNISNDRGEWVDDRVNTSKYHQTGQLIDIVRRRGVDMQSTHLGRFYKCLCMCAGPMRR